MKKLLFISIIIGVFFLWWNIGKYSWRQKLTVTIDTPDGPKSGSGVVEINLRVRSRERIGGGRLGWSYWGEGAVVDLGDGKYVFALLYDDKRNGHPDIRVRKVFKRDNILPGLGYHNARTWVRQLKKIKTPIVLQPSEYPELVVFENINDPTTIMSMRSDVTLNKLFGSDYKLKEMTLEITSDAPTDGAVYKAIPWGISKKGWFSAFGKPCEVCTNEGQFGDEKIFSDFISISNFKKVKR